MNKVNGRLLGQAIKYFFVGGVCTFVDFVILYILVECFSLNYIVASVISFMCGVILNYFACRLWVFEVRIIEKRWYEFLSYLLISLVGLGINTLCIWILTHFVGLYFMISKLGAAFVSYFWNFLSRKYLLHYNKLT